MKSTIASAIVASLSAGLLAQNISAQTASGWEYSFPKRIYIGIGGGASTLEPDTSDVLALDVTEPNSTGSHFALGWDFSRRMSAELQYVDLGTAELSQDGLIDYAETSLSAIYYLWNHRTDDRFSDLDGLDLRQGLSFFGRFGLGRMENKANLIFERDNDVQLLGGLGLEYGFGWGGAVRAEYVSYDRDAKYGGLTLLYRFGSSERGARDGVASVPDTDRTELPPFPPLSGSQRPLDPGLGGTTGDSDGDGVPDLVDDCPESIAGRQVNEYGCAYADEGGTDLQDGVLEGVTFATNSARLTGGARQVLDQVAQSLLASPSQRIAIEAHTDNRGGEKNNLELSRLRALAVVRYLTLKGVSLDRFEARAFGERRPIESNETAAGRKSNRRVEIRLVHGA